MKDPIPDTSPLVAQPNPDSTTASVDSLLQYALFEQSWWTCLKCAQRHPGEMVPRVCGAFNGVPGLPCDGVQFTQSRGQSQSSGSN